MNVVLAGYGVEGKASFDYWSKLGHAVAIADERSEIDAPTGIRTILGSDAFSKLGEFDLIVRSPSISPKKLPYGDKVWSATNEFFAKCPVGIIGVTGTKGKGTTSSLIASILRAAGRTVQLVGNIGMPALKVLSEIHEGDLVVYELSSFQLWDLKKSPQISVILGIEPDHLDIHENMEDYVAAKRNISAHRKSSAWVFYNGNNEISSAIAASVTVDDPEYRKPNDYTKLEIEDGYFTAMGRKLAPVSALQLPGAHNIENTKAAISALLPILDSIPDAAFDQGLRDFTGLPHRLKFVAEKRGVKYYDDSIATTPGSAIAAMKSFEQPKILILGGSDKGAMYDEVVECAKRTGTRIIAIGQTGAQIAALCEAAGIPVTRVEGYMNDVVATASQAASQGDVVILSPASASFDQYKSYADRGEKFVQAVSNLADGLRGDDGE